MAKDPVCGMEVKPEKVAATKSQFEGQTYYFCSGSCKLEFEKNPQRYAAEKKTEPAGRNK